MRTIAARWQQPDYQYGTGKCWPVFRDFRNIVRNSLRKIAHAPEACSGMWDTILMAFALMLVLEGLLPFLVPGFWRETFQETD